MCECQNWSLTAGLTDNTLRARKANIRTEERRREGEQTEMSRQKRKGHDGMGKG